MDIKPGTLAFRNMYLQGILLCTSAATNDWMSVRQKVQIPVNTLNRHASKTHMASDTPF